MSLYNYFLELTSNLDIIPIWEFSLFLIYFCELFVISLW